MTLLLRGVIILISLNSFCRLFFAASTYVWVQYVWHTGRGSNYPQTDRGENIYRVFPRKRNLPPNGVPLASFCLHRSCHSSQGKGSVMLNIHSNITTFHHSLIIYFPPLLFPFAVVGAGVQVAHRCEKSSFPSRPLPPLCCSLVGWRIQEFGN